MNNKNSDFNKLPGNFRSPAVVLLLSLMLTGVAQANILGSDHQNFNSSFSRQDFITSQSSSTLGKGQFSLGLFVNHANNTLPYFESDANHEGDDTSQKYNDSVSGANLTVAYGITNRWDVGIDVPQVIYQHVESDDLHGQFKKRGITGVRLGTKVRLFEKGPLRLATSGSLFFDTMRDNPYSGNAPHYAIELIPELDLGYVRIAANLGYRFRSDKSSKNQEADNQVNPLQDQALGSLAVSVPLSPRTAVLAELYGARSKTGFSDTSARSDNNAELLVGLKQELQKNLWGQIGLGRETQHALSSPDIRGYMGVHWNIGSEKPRTPKTVEVVAPPKTSIAVEHVEILSDILFDYDSATINHEAAKVELQKIAHVIMGPRGLQKMIIEGHTCALGRDAYNLDLSERRARAVRDYFIKNFNIPASKLQFRGLGEAFPVAANDIEVNRRKNRRVEFKIYHLTH